MQQKLVNEQTANEYEEVGEAETLEPAYEFKPKEQHMWKQQGPYLVCYSCEIQHAVFVGMERVLVGLNPDGTPILKERK